MKPHLQLKLRPEVSPLQAVPHWRELIDDKGLAPERFYRPVDEALHRHGVPVWVTHEHRPAGPSGFSPEEVRSGLNRIYRLVLQRESELPASLIADISIVPGVEYVRPGLIAVAPLPRPFAAAMSATTDRASREAIGLPEAHLHSRGDPGITVAVLDTGVALDHPELTDALRLGQDFVDIIDGADRFVGDFLGADAIPDDEVGHGTHVAGIVAGKGLAMPDGVAPECRVLPVRVLGAMERDGKRLGAGLVDNINAGIKYAIDEGADVISMSLGIEPAGAETPHAEVIDYARRRRVAVVAATGNDGTDTHRYYPGALPWVIAVGAADRTGEVAAFSTFGEQVDLVAPGTDIYSSSLDQGYAFSTGTSHATPFVSGAVALLQSFAKRRGRRLTDTRIKRLLKATADRADRRFRTRRAGYGRLNVIDALRLLDHQLT